MYVNGLQLQQYQLSPGCGNNCGFDQGSKPGQWSNLAVTPSGGGSLLNMPQNHGAVGKFSLRGPIYLGGRADEDDHRFFTGAISGLQIFTDGASAGDFQCICKPHVSFAN